MRMITALVVLCLSSPVFAGASAWIPVEIDNGQIIIPITLSGEPARALLDTGAEGHAISESFLASHEGAYTKGKPLTVSGVATSRRTNWVNNVDIGLFGVEFEIDDLMPILDDDIDFILGLPFFELFVVQIDYPGQRMRIVDRKSLDLKKFANVKMKRAAGSGRPQIQVDLNGEMKAWLMLDTGSNGGIFMRRSKIEKLGWLDKYRSTEGTVTGVNDVATDTESFSLPAMTIGPYEMENVVVFVPAEGEKTNISRFERVSWSTGTDREKDKKTLGVLGYDVLQHFIVTIDFKRSLLNLDVPR